MPASEPGLISGYLEILASFARVNPARRALDASLIVGTLLVAPGGRAG